MDRLGLYFLPIQMLVASHLPDIMNFTAQSKKFIKSLIISGYAITYVAWLALAHHAYAWVPYKMALWQ